MTKSTRSATILMLSLGALLLAGTSRAQTRPPIVEQIAKTYGLDSFGQLDAIRYTFNLELPALKVSLSRTWTWEPKTGQVTYESKDKDGKPVKVTYNRNQLSSAPDNVKNEIEPGFVNDNYWLIFPFHAYWDTSAVVTVKEKQKLPLAKGTATLVSVKYPPEVGGYTPGDTWELWVGSNNRVQEFFYHRGGPKKPSEVKAAWVGYKNAGPLLISTEHRGTADGGAFHLAFTGVAVKLAGSDKWVDAQ
jgi:hypothetical protein